MIGELQAITGSRGENIMELCLTDYVDFPRPLFRPGFLGDTWPAIDYYVELNEVPNRRLYFFVQVKSTTAAIYKNSLRISSKKNDISRLLEIPGPTYIIGVHEPTKRVFVRSVHTGTAAKAITRIPLTHELTSANLQRLHTEVKNFWMTTDHKPVSSVFK
jgi:Domain of unknown function (DUF4365)